MPDEDPVTEPGPDSEADPEGDSDLMLIAFVNRCQNAVARFTRQPAVWVIMYLYTVGFLPLDEFHNRMVELQQNPNYEHLRFLWDVCLTVQGDGAMWLEDIPLFGFPVALYVMMNFLLWFGLLFRDILWKSYLHHARNAGDNA